MGQNRRHPGGLERDLANGERTRALRGTPRSLSAEEVRATGRRRDAVEPVAVKALVPFRVEYEDVRELGADVDAHATAWTDDAVLIRYHDSTGEHHVWVFAAVVRRRP